VKTRPIRWLIALFAALAALAAVLLFLEGRAVPDASADSLSSERVRLERVFADVPLAQPVWLTQPPDDPDRWYALEQKGRIVTFTSTSSRRARTIALDLTDRVRFGGEQGLLGHAFHPRYAQNGYAYVNYVSASNPRRTVVSRFTRASDGVGFDRGSEKILLRVEQPYSNHNGGGQLFGPDGHLYVGFGDGGLAGDPHDHGQNTRTLLGAMVRIDVDGGDPYEIPSDNPFADGRGGAPEVFAWGLRNPWRFSFDRKTGKLWAGDVGQNAWEEIDVVERGKNYGWAVREGNHCYDPPVHLKIFGSGECGEADKGLTPPVFEFSQRRGDRSVTGGYVYRGKRNPGLGGKYVYGDFVSGRIWAFDPATGHNELLLDTPLSISSFVESADGEIGVLSYADGAVYHLTTP